MEDLKKLKCELCGRESYILIQIEVASDTFGRNRGICPECFNGGGIEEKIFLKNKKFIGEQLDSAKERVDYWKKELENF